MTLAVDSVRSNNRSSSAGSFTPLEDEDRVLFEHHSGSNLSRLETLRRYRVPKAPRAKRYCCLLYAYVVPIATEWFGRSEREGEREGGREV